MYICPGRQQRHCLDSANRSCRRIHRWAGPAMIGLILGGRAVGGAVFIAISPEGNDFKEHAEEGEDTAMILVTNWQ